MCKGSSKSKQKNRPKKKLVKKQKQVREAVAEAAVKNEFNKPIAVVVCREIATRGRCDVCRIDDLPI
jgi:hypothetical protein